MKKKKSILICKENLSEVVRLDSYSAQTTLGTKNKYHTKKFFSPLPKLPYTGSAHTKASGTLRVWWEKTKKQMGTEQQEE